MNFSDLLLLIQPFGYLLYVASFAFLFRFFFLLSLYLEHDKRPVASLFFAA